MAELQHTMERRITEIEERNTRVEADKAWETSRTRKVVIFVFTYIVALVWLSMIHEVNAFLKALVPAMGWWLSTLTIPFVKRYWVKRRDR